MAGNLLLSCDEGSRVDEPAYRRMPGIPILKGTDFHVPKIRFPSPQSPNQQLDRLPIRTRSTIVIERWHAHCELVGAALDRAGIQLAAAQCVRNRASLSILWDVANHVHPDIRHGDVLPVQIGLELSARVGSHELLRVREIAS